jgi:CHASE1-domain containing sensor protein
MSSQTNFKTLTSITVVIVIVVSIILGMLVLICVRKLKIKNNRMEYAKKIALNTREDKESFIQRTWKHFSCQKQSKFGDEGRIPSDGSLLGIIDDQSTSIMGPGK